MSGLTTLIKNKLSYSSTPDFLIIGAQKAGTTSLDSYLKYHPQLQGTFPKELHYFDNKEINSKGLKWYLSHFRRYFFLPKKLLFESTPNYLFNLNAPIELQKINPQLQCIVLLRDPIERAYSAWNMFRSNTQKLEKEGKKIPDYYKVYIKENGAFMSFEEMVEEELRRIENGEVNPPFDETFTLLRKGNYAQQIEYWQRYFPKENFYIAPMQELIDDPLKFLNQLSQFLKIKEFTQLPIDFSPRNQRDYSMKISKEVEEKLQEYFKLPKVS